jgi:hypothetical protein
MYLVVKLYSNLLEQEFTSSQNYTCYNNTT